MGLYSSGVTFLSINSITTSGDFALANTATSCPYGGGTIPVGAGCSIDVTFTPSATGIITGMVTITDNNNGTPGSTQTLSLIGTGVLAAPVLGALPGTLTFTSQLQGTPSASQPVTLSNVGNEALTINSIGTIGDFSQTNDCGGGVATSTSCTINVTFTPTEAGPRTGTLTITDNNNGVADSMQTVGLSGTGIAAAPVVGALPSLLTFTGQLQGTPSTSQPVTLSNTGNDALTVTNINASGDFSQTNNCGSSVAASSSCIINVTFTPTAAGTRTGTLTITDNNDNAPGSTQAVSLSGTGIAAAPVVGALPSLLTFTSQLQGTSSAAQPVMVSNTGNVALIVTNISASGDFSQTNNCGTSVAASGSCMINVTFTPTATGTRTGILTITDNNNGTAGSMQTVNLTGIGTLPVAGVLPGTLTFTSQTVGTSSASQPVTLSNTGTAALSIADIAASGDFSQTSTCGATLPAGATCPINVTFTPTTNGARTGTLTITDNTNGVAGSTQTVSLTGMGIGAPVASLSPPSLTFDSLNVGKTSGSQTATLTNTGSLPLTVSSITATGNFAQTNNCPSSVAVGASCTMNVTFAPLAAGTLNGALTITDNSNNTTGSTQTVRLSGTGLDFVLAPNGPPSVTIAPGQATTYTLSVGGEVGSNQTVNFTCTGAPAEASCIVGRTRRRPAALSRLRSAPLALRPVRRGGYHSLHRVYPAPKSF